MASVFGKIKEKIGKIFGVNKHKEKIAHDTEHEISEVIKNDKTPIKNHEKEWEETSFEKEEYDYKRHINKWTNMNAFSHLEGMAKNAKTKEEQKQFTLHITSGVLNGIFWENTDRDTKDQIMKICQTTGRLIGLWIDSAETQEKARNLFELFNKIADKENNKKERSEKQKLENFSERLDDVNGISELSQDKNASNEDRKLLKEYLALGTHQMTKGIEANPFSKWPEIIEVLLKDKPTQETKAFWDEVVKKLPKGQITSKDVEFYVKKFESWFGEKMLTEMIDWIKNENMTSKISLPEKGKIAEDAINAFRKLFEENIDEVEKILGHSTERSHTLAA